MLRQDALAQHVHRSRPPQKRWWPGVRCARCGHVPWLHRGPHEGGLGNRRGSRRLARGLRRQPSGRAAVPNRDAAANKCLGRSGVRAPAPFAPLLSLPRDHQRISLSRPCIPLTFSAFPSRPAAMPRHWRRGAAEAAGAGHGAADPVSLPQLPGRGQRDAGRWAWGGAGGGRLCKCWCACVWGAEPSILQLSLAGCMCKRWRLATSHYVKADGMSPL